MATWSSFEKDKLLVEDWRKFLQEESQVVFGLNSKDNEDSLINILNKLAGGLTPDQTISIVNLIADAASDEGVMLEAVALQGSKSEKDRVFSSETTRDILQGIVDLGLDTQKQKAVVKALNYWGRVNTVKFEKPAAASSVAPDEAPNEEPQAEPEAAPEAAAAETPAEVASDPVYKMNGVFDAGHRAALYSSWKAKRRNRDKSTNTFNNDLKTFVDFVAPFLPSHYINERNKKTLFDRGEFVSRKQEMRDAYNKKDEKVKQAINRIYRATQQKAATKLNILFHILNKIIKKER
jgi:hypothetical protein